MKLFEVREDQFQPLIILLRRLLQSYKLLMIPTSHSIQRLLIDKDPSHTHISAAALYDTIKKFLQKEFRSMDKYRQHKKEYVAVITNTTEKLNVVISIAYDRPPELNGMHSFKLITAKVKDNFGSDNFPDSIRVVVD